LASQLYRKKFVINIERVQHENPIKINCPHWHSAEHRANQEAKTTKKFLNTKANLNKLERKKANIRS
jgi:hypothetical protein